MKICNADAGISSTCGDAETAGRVELARRTLQLRTLAKTIRRMRVDAFPDKSEVTTTGERVTNSSEPSLLHKVYITGVVTHCC